MSIHKSRAVVCIAVFLFFSLPSALADSADDLANRLATLRAEVESLSEQLTQDKTNSQTELQSLARQKSDLSIELDREQVRIAKLRTALEKKREKLASDIGKGDDLAPIFVTAVDTMRAYVRQGLPFRQVERIKAIDGIQEQRQSGILSYPRALVRLWSFIEDEFRMTRESGAFQQTIAIDGQEQLAQVVRLGMVAMLFQNNAGGVGFSTNKNSQWSFVKASDSEERKNIRQVFDSFKKQIRVGLFTIPAVFPEVSQ